MTNTTMESNSLLIRPTVFDDCRYFAQWMEADPEVSQFFTMDQGRDFNEIAEEFVIRTLDKTMLQLTIVSKDREEPIGRIWISRIDTHANSLDITRIYIGNKEFRGRGLGEESLRLLLEYCFISLHMERVTLDHMPENKRAASLYQKLGFQYEGCMRHAGNKDGVYVDLMLMSMLRSEYYANLRDERM